MALHPDLPRSPYAELDPAHRWFPADEALRSAAYEQLLPPLVARIRVEVKAWRDSGYAGASGTSRALLQWWFGIDRVVPTRRAAWPRLRRCSVSTSRRPLAA